MKLSFRTRAKRPIALLMLLGWLFALASGIANACLLETRVTHAHAASVEGTETAHAFISAGHAGVVADHDDPHGARALCLQVCDDGARSLSNKDLTTFQADPGPTPLMSIFWTAQTPVATTHRRRSGVRPAFAERPIRVRYARLAL